MPTTKLSRKDVYIVSAESTRQCFRSLSADPISYEVQRGECLREHSEDVNEEDKELNMFTLFSPKPMASALAPSSPILFPSKLSVVSIYEREVKLSTGKTRSKRCLPCFLGKHQPLLWFLQRQYHYLRDRV
jgi:hypothetical protein